MLRNAKDLITGSKILGRTYLKKNTWFRLFEVVSIHPDGIQPHDIRKSCGNTFIIKIDSHTNNVVFAHTLLVSHGFNSKGSIQQLAATTTTHNFTVRLVTAAYSKCYLDILDDVSYHATTETNPLYANMDLAYCITLLSNSKVNIINEYVTDDDIPTGYKISDKLTTKLNTAIFDNIEKKLLNKNYLLYDKLYRR